MAAPRREYPRAPGVALVVCMDFAGTRNPLPGAAKDFQHLKDMFMLMGFRTFPVTEKLSWSLEEFRVYLKHAMGAFDEADLRDEPFFLCVSTHGDRKELSFSDGSLSRDGIRDLLAEQPKLRGRAKVIVLQACRGEKCMPKEGPRRSRLVATASAVGSKDPYGDTLGSKDPYRDTLGSKDPYGDTLGIASSVEGRVSYSTEFGSIFLVEFCYEVIRLLHEHGQCSMDAVKDNVVQTMESRRTISNREVSETVHTTPEVFINNMPNSLVLEVRDNAAAPRLFEEMGVNVREMRRQYPAERVEEEEPDSALAPVPELDLFSLSGHGPDDRRRNKAATLVTIRQGWVRRLTGVRCHRDPAWALDVLRSAAPTLEELRVLYPREEHLLAVHAMPGLRRLHLKCDDALATSSPLPPGSLQWLRVNGLPWPTLQSLLRAHSATLDVLCLHVGVSDDLDALLGQCGLRVVRLLLRRKGCTHCPSACTAQVAAVRRVLPDANVLCKKCDNVAPEPF